MILLFSSIAIGTVLIIYLTLSVLDKSPGNEKTERISNIIQKGARSFLFQEYTVFFPIVIVLALLFTFTTGYKQALSFIIGSVFSVLAGFFGMMIATKSNARTAWGATKGVGEALDIAFSGGAVMGLTVSVLGLLGLSIVYLTFGLQAVSYYSLGASFVALFARVGGGIYTKAADVGADIVGKVESNLPEDDPRNPAVIADNVGDNVGDVAGMGADLYESYVGSIFSGIALGYILFGDKGILNTLYIVGFGLIASILAIILVKVLSKMNTEPALALRSGTIASSVVFLIFSLAYAIIEKNLNLFWVVLIGNIVGVAIGLITEWYTSGKKVEKLAHSAMMGPANVIISGTALGMESTAVITIIIAVGTLLAYKIAGLYGIAMAGVGMLATLAMNLSVDAYGPIADNAGGVAEMSGLDKSVRAITDKLDALGNTTAAMGKGFAIGSAALTAIALFANFGSTAHVQEINLQDPKMFIGALIGAMLTFFFSALTMNAVGDAANDMVEEIRRQIKEIPGILSGTSEPDYQSCIKIATKGALKRMVLPAILAILAPIILMVGLGVQAVAGLLIGSTVTGVALAIFMANSGGAWDNAKKYVEEGHLGGKGSFTHKATVVGDTVGDPYKDTAGPSLNILIKLMAITSIVFYSIVGRWL
ncbi:sodium-translocating pyrophosphatase [Fervidobacterium nodosum]|uniref:Putative K(+)-stimulated pyrophosphate-energized sodium pump n=1 Tax=Fervidobacterium nodosum (strain ATCC 35602 / DSM 5306 / Rt17-B1) TaxID=381764 RepID=A7HMQ6_FERNB|nr:sodium-translocating pyrophosphatase [Fervidobacterium nodosum]ABS61189.1 V-type H(+)-translocating pyrophosphatase [Fervidobacterium nodosum Rt17-B1]PHJ13546.1 potassium transporter [Fervidobacterium sp. SC_NGM5_G05]